MNGQTIAVFLTEHQEPEEELINIHGTIEVASICFPPRKGNSDKEAWIQQEVKRISNL